MARNVVQYTLGTLSAANEYTTMVFAKDFRNAIFTVVAANSAACTIKFYASNSDATTPPTLASVASATNLYAPTQVIDLDTHASVDGSTGVVYAGSSDGVHRYEVNENVNNWIGVKMTARTAGDVTITVELTDNS